MQLTLKEMFKRISYRSDLKHLKYSVKISMIEVYNENIRDLLNPNASPNYFLDLREDPIKGTYLIYDVYFLYVLTIT